MEAQRTETDIGRLRNSFGDFITAPKRMTNLVTFRFTKLGDHCGKKKIDKLLNDELRETNLF